MIDLSQEAQRTMGILIYPITFMKNTTEVVFWPVAGNGLAIYLRGAADHDLAVFLLVSVDK